MRRIVQLSAVILGASVAVAAIGKNGRPPPVGSAPAPIKIGGGPAPAPSSTPLRIGKEPENKQSNELAGLPTEAQVFEWLLKQPLDPKTYTWTVNQPLQLLDPVKTHLCLLTGVSGNFAGAGERVSLDIDKGAAGGARWTLSGTSGQAQLRATVTCVEKAKFVPAVLAPDQMMSAYRLAAQENGACPDQITPTGWKEDKWAHFVAEVGGKWRGGGERVAVVRQSQGYGAMLINGCSGYVRGAVLAVGSTPPTAKYWTPTGRTATAANATFAQIESTPAADFLTKLGVTGAPFIVASGGSNLAPVNEAVCGIVYIAGKFQGYGEGVDIKAEGGYWRFYVNNAATDNGFVNAAVRCYARDQR